MPIAFSPKYTNDQISLMNNYTDISEIARLERARNEAAERGLMEAARFFAALAKLAKNLDVPSSPTDLKKVPTGRFFYTMD